MLIFKHWMAERIEKSESSGNSMKKKIDVKQTHRIITTKYSVTVIFLAMVYPSTSSSSLYILLRCSLLNKFGNLFCVYTMPKIDENDKKGKRHRRLVDSMKTSPLTDTLSMCKINRINILWIEESLPPRQINKINAIYMYYPSLIHPSK